jgi:hypothetical protein
MLRALEPGPLAELERALAAKLRPRDMPADRLGAEFELLARLVNGWDGVGRSPAQRALYDELAGPTDPLSRNLVRKHGSWVDACLAAVSFAASASKESRQPWATARVGQPRPADYAAAEIVRAFVECWRAIGREPSSNVYYSWVAEQRRRARVSGSPVPRLPTQRTVGKHFKRWGDLRLAARHATGVA